jgi:hypothetical protein
VSAGRVTDLVLSFRKRRRRRHGRSVQKRTPAAAAATVFNWRVPFRSTSRTRERLFVEA